ncbi:hypothetical protein CVU75_03355 [Candidatus Dependentiae bacterium HGW-Dependentiae-1]|nr:MAG: hypothetical protein CVU75_03355 [Candidatus Dependentiae bacterium HGW-Dependentiae-1]
MYFKKLTIHAVLICLILGGKTLCAGSTLATIPPILQKLLTELSLPIPDSEQIKNAPEEEPLSFFNHFLTGLTPEDAAQLENIDQNYLKNMLRWVFIDKTITDPMNKYPSYMRGLMPKTSKEETTKSIPFMNPWSAAKKLRFELIALKNGFPINSRSFGLIDGKNTAFVTVDPQATEESINTSIDMSRHWQRGIYGFEDMRPVHPEAKKHAREILVNMYKVHLMPRDEDLFAITDRLFQALKENPDISAAIPLLKYMALKEADLQKSGVPKIVIYITQGKEAAQKVVNFIHTLFKDTHGCGLAPAYNEKISDLIFVTQGDRDRKNEIKNRKDLDPIFEQPDMVYYVADFTGEQEDYHIKNPAKK